MARKRATIIFNPASGRSGSRAEDAQLMAQLLDKRGIDTKACATRGPNDATEIAREAVRSGADMIVSYGGDGTLNEVIQAMANTQTQLAVWAGGTANVVAVDLEMPKDINKLADVIAAGREKRISLGVVRAGNDQRTREWENGRMGEWGNRSIESSPTPPLPHSPTLADHFVERYFFMFAGIGLDASIARQVNPRLKRRMGEFAFWVEGVRHLFAWKPENFVIDIDGQKHEAVFALVGKGKGYGGGFHVTPHARLEDPWFEVYLVPRRSNNFAYLADLARCFRGAPPCGGVKLIQGRHIEANSSETPWVEVDGEVIGRLPMIFDVAPDALSVIVP
jgi:YegS/Rv2252/BmrU family lipid kinase